MFGIDLRNDHGDIRGPAVGAVVGNNGGLCLRVRFLDGADLLLGHVDRAEAEIHFRRDRVHILHVFDNDVPDRLGDRLIQFPSAFHRLGIGLARAAGTCRDGGHLEPGVIVQKGNESLSDHAGTAQDTYSQFLTHL